MEGLIDFLEGQAKPDVFCVECKEKRVVNAKLNKVNIPKQDLIIMPIYRENNPELNVEIGHNIKKEK